MGRSALRRTAILRKLAVTGLCLVAWRALAFIPVPFVTPSFIAQVRSRAPSSPLLAGMTGSPIELDSVIAMGLNPFLIAFVVFWLARVLPDAQKAWADPASQWRVLLMLTLFFALLQGEGLTRPLFNDHPQDVLAATGLTATGALMVGTMILFGLGRIIDRFGLPPTKGVWFLFALESVRRGLHMLGIYLHTHALSGQLLLHLLAYAVATVLVGAGVIAVVRAKRPVVIEPQPGPDGGKVPSIEFGLVMGGVVFPLVIANYFTYLPVIPAELLGPQAVAWVDKNFFATGPLVWVDVLFVVGYFAAIVGACIFAMRFNFDADLIAGHLAESGYRLPGVSGAEETARSLGGISMRTTVIGSIAVASLVVAYLFCST